MSVLVRAILEADWPTLKQVRLAALRDSPTAFGVSYDTAAAYTDEQWRQRASPATQPEFFIAYESADQDAGQGAGQGAEAVGLIGGGTDQSGRYNLIAMWLRPDLRGSGIAAALVDMVKARALELGHRRIVLDVWRENTRAANFYLRQGFVFIDEWSALDSHPDITVQNMEWLSPDQH
jgi:GNAT superfamily N-acetyltransferase